jgi:hypothetical protein
MTANPNFNVQRSSHQDYWLITCRHCFHTWYLPKAERRRTSVVSEVLRDHAARHAGLPPTSTAPFTDAAGDPTHNVDESYYGRKARQRLGTEDPLAIVNPAERERAASFIEAIAARFGSSVTITVRKPHTELRANVGTVGGRKDSSVPRKQKTKMDMSKYAGGNFLKVADLEAQGSFKARIVAVEAGKFDKANLILSEGSVLSLSVTNVNTLIRAFGADSRDWLDQEIMCELGETEFEGKPVKMIVVRPLGEAENKKPISPAARKKKSGGEGLEGPPPF